MLEVNQLSRSYRCFLAVDKVSFAIGKGEIVGLLGRNGAGKTTIMKMISGYLESNTGSVIVDGVDLDANPKEVLKSPGLLTRKPACVSRNDGCRLLGFCRRPKRPED